MPSFLVLFYEDDRRRHVPDPSWATQHQERWKTWLQTQIAAGTLRGGNALEMAGSVIDKNGKIADEPYFHGDEMVGGFLIIEAENLAAATALAASCPVFEAGGFAEVRPFKTSP